MRLLKQSPKAAACRHLKILCERRLVQARRDGMNVYFSLTNDKGLKAPDLLRQMLNENLAHGVRLTQALVRDLDRMEQTR